mmetsp:Transcript_87787/g.272745  ORF Transcript_87787/g.272745 Transcript_87787/m.272745 type:complete len:284 (+) Transcript_87787:480-1331(+)
MTMCSRRWGGARTRRRLRRPGASLGWPRAPQRPPRRWRAHSTSASWCPAAGASARAQWRWSAAWSRSPEVSMRGSSRPSDEQPGPWHRARPEALLPWPPPPRAWWQPRWEPSTPTCWRRSGGRCGRWPQRRGAVSVRLRQPSRAEWQPEPRQSTSTPSCPSAGRFVRGSGSRAWQSGVWSCSPTTPSTGSPARWLAASLRWPWRSTPTCCCPSPGRPLLGLGSWSGWPSSPSAASTGLPARWRVAWPQGPGQSTCTPCSPAAGPPAPLPRWPTGASWSPSAQP